MEYWPLAVVFLILTALFLHYENTVLDRSFHQVSSEKLPPAFDGFTVCHLSDIHNTLNRRLKNSIIAAIENNRPDIIAITGDLIDCRRTNYKTALDFVRQLLELAPVYYIAGNHETRLDRQKYLAFEERLIQAGVNVLDNTSISLKKDSQEITLAGLKDPGFECEYSSEYPQYMRKYLSGLTDKQFSLLLVHRPELLKIYSEYGIDLVLSGHAHGGQIRLPYIGGLFAPGQGILPKITSGMHTEANTRLIVSRGIGNSLAPFRIFDHPEIIFITLKR